MLYDRNGIYVGEDDSTDVLRTGAPADEWRTEVGYAAYGVSDVRVGSIIKHGKEWHTVAGIKEVVRHSDDTGLAFMVLLDDGTELYFQHYGTPRHSGRYPWGSGENPYQRSQNFLSRYDQLFNERDENGKHVFTKKQIADALGMKTQDLVQRVSLARSEVWQYEFSEYERLKKKGMSRSAIARRMGRNESTLRNWEKQSTQNFMSRNDKNAKVLEDRVNESGFIQVGAGAEYFLNNCSKGVLDNALKALEMKGYNVHNIQIEQLGTGKMTTVKVLTKPGVTKKDVYDNLDKIRLPDPDYIYEQDKELKKARDYVSVNPDRVQVRYAEDGGIDKDGLIEIRRNVPDLDIGRNHYVQGRILVDGDHYLKGMIAYADDLDPGVDIRFNTNKHRGTPMINREDKDNSVLKPIKTGQENIFGANIKPDDKLVRAHRTYIDENGEEKQSAVNIVKEEGDVDAWSKNLASQFVSKQPPALAKRQLKLLYDNSKADMEEVAAYTNPVVKEKMLEDLAGRFDHDAVHLQAAALPRQKSKFIMPLTNVKDNECYCPSFDDGEQIALVRYPHGSITEIPILTVNNNNKEAKRVLGDAVDAVGISPRAAERLSGADFDGDTVIALPTDKIKIASKPQYPGLVGFSTTESFPGYEGMKRMTKHQKGVEMGVASNLITDMTIQGAKPAELERALKYSMVVIDAEKHGLNWRLAEEQLGIAALKKRYQPNGGPSTLLSRSTAEDRTIKERKLKTVSTMSPEEYKRWKSGEDIYVNTNRTIKDYKKTYPRSKMTKDEKAMVDSGDKEKMWEVYNRMLEDGRAQETYKDVREKPIKKGYLYNPYELTSTGDRDTAQRIEIIYADHAVAMKDLAKQARAMARDQAEFKKDKVAEEKYKREVESLKSKLAIAERNAPLERQAQIKANLEYRQWLDDHPGEDSDHKKRQRGIILDAARRSVGAKKLVIGSDDNPLTPKEWEAIQAHAISRSKLRDILNNSDMNVVRKYAMPKTKTGLAPAKLSRAKMLLNSGYSRKEVCDQLDISESTLIDAIGKANI